MIRIARVFWCALVTNWPIGVVYSQRATTLQYCKHASSTEMYVTSSATKFLATFFIYLCLLDSAITYIKLKYPNQTYLNLSPVTWNVFEREIMKEISHYERVHRFYVVHNLYPNFHYVSKNMFVAVGNLATQCLQKVNWEILNVAKCSLDPK